MFEQSWTFIRENSEYVLEFSSAQFQTANFVVEATLLLKEKSVERINKGLRVRITISSQVRRMTES